MKRKQFTRICAAALLLSFAVSLSGCEFPELPEITTPTYIRNDIPTTPTEPAITDPTEPTEPSETTEPTEPAALYGTITAKELNIRSAPGTASEVVGRLKAGDRVKILETQDWNGAMWAQIKSGWISMKYVVLDSGSSQETGIGISGTVVSSSLRIRSEPNTKSDIIRELRKGDRVSLHQFTHVGKTIWGQCDEGWVSMDYVTLDTGYTPGTELIGIVVNGDLRVRKGPSTDYDVVTILLNGQEIAITDFRTTAGTVWGKTAQGWVNLDFIEFGCQIVLQPGTNG